MPQDIEKTEIQKQTMPDKSREWKYPKIYTNSHVIKMHSFKLERFRGLLSKLHFRLNSQRNRRLTSPPKDGELVQTHHLVITETQLAYHPNLCYITTRP